MRAIGDLSGLWAREHLELIEGDLISKMGKSPPHTIALFLVMEWLESVFGGRYVTSETPIDVSPEDNPLNEPEPDLIVRKRPFTEYRVANPPASEVRLLIEISDITLALDLRTKARLYARAGIQDYWVVDITGQRIVVHRDPRNGIYESVTPHNTGETIEPLSAPGKLFKVADAFTPGALAPDSPGALAPDSPGALAPDNNDTQSAIS